MPCRPRLECRHRNALDPPVQGTRFGAGLGSTPRTHADRVQGPPARLGGLVARQRPPPPGAPPTSGPRPPPGPAHRASRTLHVARPLGSPRRPLAASLQSVAGGAGECDLGRGWSGVGAGRDTKTTESLTVLGELLWRREGTFPPTLHVCSQDLCAFPCGSHSTQARFSIGTQAPGKRCGTFALVYQDHGGLAHQQPPHSFIDVFSQQMFTQHPFRVCVLVNCVHAKTRSVQL